MTHTPVPGVAAEPARALAERENQRGVELIEKAEQSSPYCVCGSHMIAVGHEDEVWLECAAQNREKSSLGAFVARLTSWNHSRRMIMETPDS